MPESDSRSAGHRGPAVARPQVRPNPCFTSPTISSREEHHEVRGSLPRGGRTIGWPARQQRDPALTLGDGIYILI